MISADGNVRALKELIIKYHDKKYGKILYISGRIISSNLDKELSKEGYEIFRIINYLRLYINLIQKQKTTIIYMELINKMQFYRFY